ncbi:unnamed protein product, partial [Durusdinium trenchii]
ATIRDVQNTSVIGVIDLPWISSALGKSIRLTVHPELMVWIRESGHAEMREDTIFGDRSAPIGVHFYLSWLRHEDGRKYGHFDILMPSMSKKEESMMLLPDAAWQS